MINDFIEKNCKTCNRCIFERNAYHRFFPYPYPEEYVPTYCGEITEDGGSGILLTELETCKGYGKRS